MVPNYAVLAVALHILHPSCLYLSNPAVLHPFCTACDLSCRAGHPLSWFSITRHRINDANAKIWPMTWCQNFLKWFISGDMTKKCVRNSRHLRGWRSPLVTPRLISHLLFLVSCFLTPISWHPSLVSRLISHISRHLSLVSRPPDSHLLSRVSCLLSPVLSHNSGLMSPVSRLLSHVSCLTCPTMLRY